LVQRAFDFYLSDEAAINKPRLPFTLNDPRFFSDSRTFAGLDIKTTDSNANVLVVEGFISTNDSTKIFLNRTVIVGSKTVANPEVSANVTIENETGTVATLIEKAKGYYTTPSLILDNTKQYRIRIKTNGKTYLSDLTQAKVTPPIDSVGYTIKDDGIQVYANAHDDANKSKYYLYNYEETWKFRTAYISEYRSTGQALVRRTPSQYVNECFGFQPSVNIVLGSTAALTQDVLYKAPIAFISASSEKISIRYSILLTQTAITKEAYAFWDNLKKNTEQLGSIFDAQPSQLSGNIHNIADATEPVIGYISAGTKQTKRIFIDKTALPSNFITQYPYSCFISFVIDPGVLIYNPTRFTALYDDPLGLAYSTAACSDCTIRGRVPKPSFWQ